jgi:hypothetical protein
MHTRMHVLMIIGNAVLLVLLPDAVHRHYRHYWGITDITGHYRHYWGITEALLKHCWCITKALLRHYIHYWGITAALLHGAALLKHYRGISPALLRLTWGFTEAWPTLAMPVGSVSRDLCAWMPSRGGKGCSACACIQLWHLTGPAHGIQKSYLCMYLFI